MKPALLYGEELSKLVSDNHSLIIDESITLKKGEKKIINVDSMLAVWADGYDPTHVLGLDVEINTTDVIAIIKDATLSCSLPAQARYINYDIEVKNISNETFNGMLRLNIGIDYLKAKDKDPNLDGYLQ